MKIGVAQIRPAKGDIAANITRHEKLIQAALSLKATLLFFPELSLTGYEPALATKLATTPDDPRFNRFQQLSMANKITIVPGFPCKTKTGIRISMIFFRPDGSKSIYSKQQLHTDELPFFENGDKQMLLTIENKRIAPAICYESLQPGHSEKAYKLGADIYLASVAKSESGVQKALNYFPGIAKKYSMPVAMANCVGYCDNFESAGLSSVWTKQGRLAGQLDGKNEGILVFDTTSETVAQQIVAENVDRI